MTWPLVVLLAAVPAWSGTECNRVCEDWLKDVFGCCPATFVTTGRLGAPPDRGVQVVAFGAPPGRALHGMKQEVTQALYQAVTGSAPSANGACGAACPVERVHWCDAVVFANRLSARNWLRPAYALPEGFRPGMDAADCDARAGEVTWDRSANGWRLPTEAEWEALAALEGRPATARGIEGRTRPACDAREDGEGVCDAVGNVWEWTWDADPRGDRVVRGCSFQCGAGSANASSRRSVVPGFQDEGIGIRLVRAR